MTPEHLRASAVAWSLCASLDVLRSREAQEARVIADERAAAADPLKSSSWGLRRALGGHSDPTSDALLTLGAPPRVNRFTAVVDEIEGQLADVARHLPAPSPDSPIWGLADGLTLIAAAIPGLSKDAAVAVWRLLDRIDGRIRRLLHLPYDRQFIPRIRCPWCDAVSLLMRMTPPRPARVVECTTCDGAWPWAEVIRGR